MRNSHKLRTTTMDRRVQSTLASSTRTSATSTATTTLLASVCVGVCLIGLITSVQSGPVYERTRRMVANADETQPIISSSNGKPRNETSPNKDLCLMEGHTIPRRLVSCPTKPGCRAIQKEGECCPEYQCECERNGKLYENGEKIMDPETPCRVCYCQGGEFSCNNVTCYNRNDCKPKYTPGRCCPEYDNCPPLEINKSDHNENNSSDNTDEEHDRPTTVTKASLTTVSTTYSSSSSSSSSVPPSAVGNDNPLGIKIKEITKPEEIRITDEKPKFVHKVSTSTSTTTTSTTTTEAPSSSSSSSSSTSTTTTTAPPPSSSSSTSEATSEATSTTTSESYSFDQFNKTDDPFQLGEEFEQDLVNGTDTNKNVREVADGEFINGLMDVGAEEEQEQQEEQTEEENNDSRSLLASSTETSPYDDHHTDVKQVIIVDNFGESKPINVVGTSELQFGGKSPDEDINTYDFLASSSTTEGGWIDLGSGSGDDNETTSSDMMYSFSRPTEGENEGSADHSSTTTTTTFAPYSSSTPSEDSWTESSTSGYSSSSSSSPAPSSSTTEQIEVTQSKELSSSEEDSQFKVSSSSWGTESSSQSSAPHHENNEGTPLENDDLTNPEYPKLPEDFSQQHQEEHAGYADAEERSPGEPHLVPEWERNNATEKEEINEEEGEDRASDEEFNSVFNFEEKRTAEQTTEGFRKFHYEGISLDGDMMSENSTAEEGRSSPSPKDDVESLKMQKGDEESYAVRESSPEGRLRGYGDGEGEGVLKIKSDSVGRYLSRETSFWDLF